MAVAVAEGDRGKRAAHLVRRMGVEDDPLAGVERDEQVRLVDEVHAGLEVVAEAAPAADVPREIVAELELVLLGGLRRVAVGADRDAARKRLRRQRAGRPDVVPEISVLKDELVQLRAAEHRVVVDVDRVELVVADGPVVGWTLRGGAIGLIVVVAAVSDGQILRRIQVRRHLGREGLRDVRHQVALVGEVARFGDLQMDPGVPRRHRRRDAVRRGVSVPRARGVLVLANSALTRYGSHQKPART